MEVQSQLLSTDAAVGRSAPTAVGDDLSITTAGDYWNDTTHEFESQRITYTLTYNYYDTGPTTGMEG